MKFLPTLALCVIVLTIPVRIHGQNPVVPPDTGSKVPRDQAQAALDFHNKVRKDVGAPPLQWSPELAAVAQKWAHHLASDNNCGLSHTPNDPHGENLFGGSGAPYTALDASQDWYGEIKQYKYGPVTYQNFSATGHYTQMVWNTSTKVGIGQATCPGGGIVIAAEYDPHGNVIGQKPY
jgi:pathogenesis-related protein 1